MDYGNEEVLSTSRIRVLKDEFLVLPCQAFLCVLEDIEAKDDEWSDDAVTLLEEFTSERFVQ